MSGDPSIHGNPLAQPNGRDRVAIGYTVVAVIGLVLIAVVSARLLHIGQAIKPTAAGAPRPGVLLAPEPSSDSIPGAPLPIETVPTETVPTETVPAETLPAPIPTTPIPTTEDPSGVRTIEPIKVESAVENGVCKPEATPVPRVARYQEMRATYETVGQPRSKTTVVHRIDNELGAYEYIDRDAFHRGNEWRHLSYPDAQLGLTFRTHTDDDRQQSPQTWGITASALPTSKRALKDHGVKSVLTDGHTKLAPCVYEANSYKFFSSDPPAHVVSYVDADGWMIQQVKTAASGFRHTLVFSSPESLTIAEPPCAILTNPAYAKKIKDWCQQISWGCDQPAALPLTGPEPTATCSIVGTPGSPFQYAP